VPQQSSEPGPTARTAPGGVRLDRDARFGALVASVKDYAIFMLSPDGRVQTWNAGAELIKGYRPDEIIGKRIDLFYLPEDRARGMPDLLLGKAAADGRVEDEGWRVRKDGTRFWADVVITALRDESGHLTGYAKVTRDLTSRRAVEEALRHSEERLRLLIDSVEDYAIFMLDPHGTVVTWNAGAERIKGYRASEIIGKNFSRFRLEEDVAAGKCEQELELAARAGKLEEEGWRVRKDGTRFWANVVLTAVRGPSGELLGYAKVTRDLTDRRRLDEERVQRARAEEAVRMRDEFLSIASHELKTPLTALKIELASMQERIDPADARVVKKLDRAARNANRLAALIESLLDVSRLASGRLTLRPERVDLAEVTALLLDSMKGSATSARCELELRAPDPVWGTWDRLRLEQIVMNLVSNALKYGAGNTVTVAVSSDDGDAILEVADRGPGIADVDVARIFERFERAASMRHYGGLGLGLYVSREIVRAHGGSIAVRNRAEGGACFTVRLPLEFRQTTPNPGTLDP
jgi:PAS domain S-box-containing protein